MCASYLIYPSLFVSNLSNASIISCLCMLWAWITWMFSSNSSICSTPSPAQRHSIHALNMHRQLNTRNCKPTEHNVVRLCTCLLKMKSGHVKHLLLVCGARARERAPACVRSSDVRPHKCFPGFVAKRAHFDEKHLEDSNTIQCLCQINTVGADAGP